MIAARTGVAGALRPLLREAVGLAHRRIEVDGEWRLAGSGPGGPGAGEQRATDAVELADVAPAEAAEKGAERGRRLDGASENALCAAGAQRIGVVDAIAARQRGGDECRDLVSRVRPARCVAEVEVTVDELPQAETFGERGRQQQARVGHQAVVIEGDREPGGAAR